MQLSLYITASLLTLGCTYSFMHSGDKGSESDKIVLSLVKLKKDQHLQDQPDQKIRHEEAVLGKEELGQKSALSFLPAIDREELEELQNGIVLYDKDIELLKTAIDYEQEWKKFMASYQPVSSVTGVNLEEFIESYRKQHKKVFDDSSLEDIIAAYRHAITAQYTLEARGDRRESSYKTILVSQINYALHGGGLDLWCAHFFKKGSKEDARQNCQSIEKGVEESFMHWREKERLLNEVRSKRLFVDAMEKQIVKEAASRSRARKGL